MSTFSEAEHPRTGGGRFAAKPAAAEAGFQLDPFADPGLETGRDPDDFARTGEQVRGQAEVGDVVVWTDHTMISNNPQRVTSKGPTMMPSAADGVVSWSPSGQVEYEMRDLVTGETSSSDLRQQGWGRMVDGRAEDPVWGAVPLVEPGEQTPLGTVRRSRPVAAGIADVDCGDDNEGGIRLSEQRNAGVEESLRVGDGYYSRDTGHASIVVAAYPEEFTRANPGYAEELRARASERVRALVPAEGR